MASVETYEVGQLSPDGYYRFDGAQWVPVRHEHAKHDQSLSSFMGQLEAVTPEDLYFGQTVIVWGRWILIATGLALSFWDPWHAGVVLLAVTWSGLVALALGNFFLQIQLLRGQISDIRVVYGASLADLLVITALVVAGGGFRSDVFVFYFAAVLGFSVAFPTTVTIAYTTATVVVYALICLGTAPVDDGGAVFMRLLMIVAIAFCGNLFARNERYRRLSAAHSHNGHAPAEAGGRR